MSTSDGSVAESGHACSVCGEVLDPTRIDSGCVICNPVKWQAALKPEVPEVPVSTGPADRADGIGCLQHGIVGCPRCGQIWARHSLSGSWKQLDGEKVWYPDEDRGARGLGMLLLILLFVALMLVGSCFWVVAIKWPH